MLDVINVPPCPYCKCQPSQYWTHKADRFYIECTVTKCPGTFICGWGANEKEAAKAWMHAVEQAGG